MSRRFGRASADRTEHDRVGDVLRCDRFEKLGRRGEAQTCDLDEQAAGEAKASGHIERVVEVGVVNEPLPANGGSRLLKIDPHHDEDPVLHPFDDFQEPGGKVAGGVGIVDRAGADNCYEPSILAGQDAFDGLATSDNRPRGGLIEGQQDREPGRGHEWLKAPDAEV